MSDLTPTGPDGGTPGIDAAQLRSAMKAFKKRLKLARLDDESRLGHGALSNISRSGITAIMPPTNFPPAVWEELVRQGKLRKAGHGLYELASEIEQP
jgi:hypothetical protein